MNRALKFSLDNETGYFDSLPQSTQDLIREAILDAAQNRRGPEGWKSDDECLEDIECRRRDGFIPFSHNRGGLVYQNFSDLMAYWGGGYSVAHSGADAQIQRQIESSLNYAKESILEKHGEALKAKGITPDNLNYHSLYDTEDEDLQRIAEYLSKAEHDNLSGDDSSIMHEFRVMYHGLEDGEHRASVSAAVNTEGPYHRSHISWAPNVFCEGSKEVEITWKTEKQLKARLTKALAEVSKAVF